MGILQCVGCAGMDMSGNMAAIPTWLGCYLPATWWTRLAGAAALGILASAIVLSILIYLKERKNSFKYPDDLGGWKCHPFVVKDSNMGYRTTNEDEFELDVDLGGSPV